MFLLHTSPHQNAPHPVLKKPNSVRNLNTLMGRYGESTVLDYDQKDHK